MAVTQRIYERDVQIRRVVELFTRKYFEFQNVRYEIKYGARTRADRYGRNGSNTR